MLFLDSIEHIKGTLANAEDVHNSVERLFAGHPEKLRLPNLHVIYTVPPYLKVRHPNVDALYEPGGLIVLPHSNYSSRMRIEPLSRRISTPWNESSVNAVTGADCWEMTARFWIA